ncbi:MAG: tetratricopeptide repeat protein [Deltaproteobacteria bacterium]|nr:tetratricopeptide repeat protein [Deltaproteobacteria bacterium]
MAIDREKIQQAAQTFVEKRKYGKAIVEYRKLVAVDPNDVRTLLKIGDLHLKLDQFEGAIQTYEQVGEHYFREGFAVKAIAVYKQLRGIITRHAPQLETKYGHILPRLAEIYSQLGLTSDALAAYDEVATQLRQQGRERDALDVFKRLVELDPENPIAKLRVADSRVRLGDIEKAAEAFAEAAEIMLRLGRHDDAIKVLERLLEHDPSPEYARLCGETYLERGGPTDGMSALSKLQIAFKADPQDLDTLEVLARAFDAISQPRKAVEVLKEAARIARDREESERLSEIVTLLVERAPYDPFVLQLTTPPATTQPSAPETFASIAIEAPDILDTSVAIEEALELSEADLDTMEVEDVDPSEPMLLDMPLDSYDVETGGVDAALHSAQGIHVEHNPDVVVQYTTKAGLGHQPTPFETLSGGIVQRALEEVELLADLGRFAEARALVRSHLQNLADHPLLLDALRQIEAMAGPEEVVPLPEEFIEEEPHSWANLDPSTYALYSTGGFPVAPDSGPNRDSGAFPGRASQVPHSSSRSGNYPALAGATSSPAASSGNYPAVAGPSPASGVPTSSGAYPAVHVPDFQSQYDIGMTYLEAGRYNEAIASLSYAARDPNLEVVCRSLVGSMYLQLGDLDSGIAVLHQALGASVRTREQDVAVGYELGNAYELKGMFEQAAHFFEWLVQLDPNYGDPRGSVRERLARLRP